MLFCIITDNVMHVNIILGNSINNLLIYFCFHAILKRTFQNIQVRHRHTCREARAPKELSSARLKRRTPQLKVVKGVPVYYERIKVLLQYLLYIYTGIEEICHFNSEK